MTEEQQKLLKYAEKADIDKLLPFFEVLEEIRDILGNKEMPKVDMPVMPGTLKLEGAELVTIKGAKGDKGDSPTDAHLTNLIKPLIPEVEDGYTPIKGKDYFDGKDGYTPKKGVDYFDGENGTSPSVEDITQATSEKLTPLVPKKEEILSEVLKEGDELIKSINADESDGKIKREKIEGLDEELTAIKNIPRGREVKQQMVFPFSFSGDGVTTTFYLPKEPSGKGWLIMAHYQGQWLQKNVHYTIANKAFNTSTGTAPFTAESSTVIEGIIII